MAGTLSDDIKSRILNRMFNTTPPAALTNELWMALYTINVTAATTDITASEATYTNYARVDISGATAVTTWTIGTQGNGFRATSDSNIAFPTSGGVSNTIEGALVVDAGSGAGDAYWWDAAMSVTVDSGETPTVPAGSATFDIDIA